MAFWDQEKHKLNGFGIPTTTKLPAAISALMQKVTAKASPPPPPPKPVVVPPVVAPPVVAASTSGGVDPHAIAASVPADVKKPTPVSLPPSTKDTTSNLVNAAKQLVQQSKAAESPLTSMGSV